MATSQAGVAGRGRGRRRQIGTTGKKERKNERKKALRCDFDPFVDCITATVSSLLSLTCLLPPRRPLRCAGSVVGSLIRGAVSGSPPCCSTLSLGITGWATLPYPSSVSACSCGRQCCPTSRFPATALGPPSAAMRPAASWSREGHTSAAAANEVWLWARCSSSSITLHPCCCAAAAIASNLVGGGGTCAAPSLVFKWEHSQEADTSGRHPLEEGIEHCGGFLSQGCDRCGLLRCSGCVKHLRDDARTRRH